jgi:hypothetical protein
MTTLKPGERDEMGRVFLGWRVRWRDDSSPLGPFTDRQVASDVESYDPRARVVRVYLRESKLRRALRELVEALGSMPTNMAWADGWPTRKTFDDKYKRAVDALKEKPSRKGAT